MKVLLYYNEVSLVLEIIVLDEVQGRLLLQKKFFSTLLLTTICYLISSNCLLIITVEITKLYNLYRDINWPLLYLVD